MATERPSHLIPIIRRRTNCWMYDVKPLAFGGHMMCRACLRSWVGNFTSYAGLYLDESSHDILARLCLSQSVITQELPRLALQGVFTGLRLNKRTWYSLNYRQNTVKIVCDFCYKTINMFPGLIVAHYELSCELRGNTSPAQKTRPTYKKDRCLPSPIGISTNAEIP